MTLKITKIDLHQSDDFQYSADKVIFADGRVLFIRPHEFSAPAFAGENGELPEHDPYVRAARKGILNLNLISMESDLRKLLPHAERHGFSAAWRQLNRERRFDVAALTERFHAAGNASYDAAHAPAFRGQEGFDRAASRASDAYRIARHALASWDEADKAAATLAAIDSPRPAWERQLRADRNVRNLDAAVWAIDAIRAVREARVIALTTLAFMEPAETIRKEWEDETIIVRVKRGQVIGVEVPKSLEGVPIEVRDYDIDYDDDDEARTFETDEEGTFEACAY